VQIGTLRRELQPRFEQRNRVLKIILRHADLGQQKNHIDIFWCEFVGAYQHIQRVYRPGLIGVDLAQEIKCVRGVGFQLQDAVQRDFGLSVIASTKISAPQIEKNFKSLGLQRVGFLELELGFAILSGFGEENTESEMQSNVVSILRGKRSGQIQARGCLPGLKIRADEVHLRFRVRGTHAL